jgi:hypothetical protein
MDQGITAGLIIIFEIIELNGAINIFEDFKEIC